MERNCWNIVAGKEVEPKATEGETIDEKKLKDFNLRCSRSYTTIYMNVSPQYRTVIEDISDGSEAWKRLKTHFRPDSRARVMALKHDFFSCVIEPDESIGLYASRLKRIIEELNESGHPVEDLDQCFQLLRFLPAEYENIVQSIYRWEDDDFKFPKVLEQILAEESRLRQRAADQATVSLLTKSQHVPETHSLPVKSHPKRRPKCQSCGETDHLKQHCPKRKGYNPSRIFSPRKCQNYLLEALTSDKTSGGWVFDCAATVHFCRQKELFSEFTPVKNQTLLGAVDTLSTPIKGTGTVYLEFENSKIKLNNVAYAPELRRNLLSGACFDKRGATFKGGKGKIDVFDCNNERLFSAKLQNGLYYVFPKCRSVSSNNPKPACNIKSKKTVSFSAENINHWHRKFAHINFDHIKSTSRNNCVRGLPNLKGVIDTCNSCKEAKGKSISFKPINKIRAKRSLEILHMDLCGPIPKPSIHGHKYFLTIIDDYSRKVFAYPLKSKSDVFDTFERFLKRAERFLDRKVKCIHTDNGLEFVNEKFKTFCEELGIQHEKTNYYSPMQNGVSERFNYTAIDGINVLLKDSGLGQGFWSEALLHFVYTWNRLCHSNQTKTPFELYGGRQPSVTHLKPFGCKAYVYVPKQLRRKLDMRSRPGILVGYAQQTKGYRIWLPDIRKVTETINVRFDEKPPSKPSADNAKFERVETVLDPDFVTNKIPLRPKSHLDTTENENSPSEIETDSEPSESESEISDKKIVNWTRKPVTRKDGSRTEIFFYEEGKTKRLRSLKDIRKYCQENNLKFQPYLFNFKPTDTYSGIISGNKESSCSVASG